jgi:hypothetical protein
MQYVRNTAYYCAMATKQKKRRGRPALAGGRVKFTTTLPESTVHELREIGQGNASQAIIQLVNAEIARRAPGA